MRGRQLLQAAGEEAVRKYLGLDLECGLGLQRVQEQAQWLLRKQKGQHQRKRGEDPIEITLRHLRDDDGLK